MAAARLVTRAELARVRGVSKKTVTMWIQKGRISTLGDGKGACIDPAVAEVELMDTVQRAQAETLALDADVTPVRTLTDHRSEVEEHRAALLKLKLERERGELVRRDQVAFEQEQVARAVKKGLDTIPSRAEDINGAAKAGGVIAVRKALRQMVRDVQEALAKGLVEAAENIEADRATNDDHDDAAA